MAITGNFFLKDYSFHAGLYTLHFENLQPGPGNPTDFYLDVPDAEMPTNISQPQLATTLKTWLGLVLNQTHGPLNTFISANQPVVLP